jgi:hypothetical protein
VTSREKRRFVVTIPGLKVHLKLHSATLIIFRCVICREWRPSGCIRIFFWRWYSSPTG